MNWLGTLAALALATAICILPASLRWSPENGVSISIDTADARVGRPLTPVSVAGVHRRAHRRAYYGAHVHHYHH
jgi:hypothetical protein